MVYLHALILFIIYIITYRNTLQSAQFCLSDEMCEGGYSVNYVTPASTLAGRRSTI